MKDSPICVGCIALSFLIRVPLVLGEDALLAKLGSD